MASVKDITVNIRAVSGRLITPGDWNRMCDALEALDRKSEQPNNLIVAAAAAGAALVASPRKVSRRSLLGLR